MLVGTVPGHQLPTFHSSLYLKYLIQLIYILQVKSPFNGWCSVRVAKILWIGDRPDLEEAGQPTHKDSFPISTERESTQSLKKMNPWKEELKFVFVDSLPSDCKFPTSVSTRFGAISCRFSSKFDTEYVKETARPNPSNIEKLTI